MSWWGWAALWAVLVIGAIGVFALLLRSLYRKAKALVKELITAQERLSAVAGELETLNHRFGPEPELAVFADPVQLRQDRTRLQQAARAGRRKSPRLRS